MIWTLLIKPLDFFKKRLDRKWCELFSNHNNEQQFHLITSIKFKLPIWIYNLATSTLLDLKELSFLSIILDKLTTTFSMGMELAGQ